MTKNATATPKRRAHACSVRTVTTIGPRNRRDANARRAENCRRYTCCSAGSRANRQSTWTASERSAAAE